MLNQPTSERRNPEAPLLTFLRHIALASIRGDDARCTLLTDRFKDKDDRARIKTSLQSYRLRAPDPETLRQAGFDPDTIKSATNDRILYSTPVNNWIARWGNDFVRGCATPSDLSIPG